MKQINEKQYIWAEKYRPSCIDDMIIPEEIREKFKGFITQGRCPHLLFTSITPGIGKTSLTNAIVKELNADVKWINGSQDGGINTFRVDVKDFITSVTIDDSAKVVVVDELDGTNQTSTQLQMRGLIEEFSMNSTFIATANYKDKIIEPLRNRFIHFDFDSIFFAQKNKSEIGAQMHQRLQFILDNEGIEYEKSDLGTVIKHMYPSMRQMTLVLQQSIENGKLVLDEKMIDTNQKYANLMNLIKNRQFVELRKAVQEMDDPSSLYTYVYKNLDLYFEEAGQPQAVLLCAKYQDMSANARDKAICTTAYCVELMVAPGIDFKD